MTLPATNPFAKTTDKSRMTGSESMSRQPMVNKDHWRRFYSVLSILIQPQIGLSDGAARQIAPGVLKCFSRLMSHTSQDHVQSPNDII